MITILLLITLLIAGCDIHAPASKLPDSKKVWVLMDQSLSTPSYEDSLNKAAVGSIIQKLLPGDRLSVISINAVGFSNPQVLYQAALPKEASRNEASFLRSREDARNKWQRVSKNLQPKSKHSDIVGALSYHAKLIEHETGQRLIIILSDMRQSSAYLNLEHKRKINTSKVLEHLKTSGDLPDLSGVSVACLNVHTRGRSITAIYYESLQQFWQQYFAAANATLVAYRPGDGLEWLQEM